MERPIRCMEQDRKGQALVIYDNRCTMCTQFARYVGRMSRSGVRLVGHYSSDGEKIRRDLLGPGALEMFWFVDKTAAYGGRAAIFPLAKNILSGLLSGGPRKPAPQQPTTAADRCDVARDDAVCRDSDCSGPKDAFVRSASLIRNSRVVRKAANDMR